MATTVTFDNMLKDYMPYSMLMEEMKKRNYLWNKVTKVEGWKGGPWRVPFEGGEYSSHAMGALTGATDVGEATPVDGNITVQPELWNTLLFNEKDLDRHDSFEQSFLKILPDKITQFIDRASQRVSIMCLNDGALAVLTADGDSTGVISVDHPEYFTIGEKVEVDDDNSSPQLGYVTAVNVPAKTITIKDARSAGAAVNLAAYTTAQNAKVYIPGGSASGFTGLRSQLLSSANGGSSTLFGVTKATYPFLQASQHDGSVITQNNILDVLYGYFFDNAAVGKGNPTEIIMSYKNFRNCAAALQSNKRYMQGDKAAGYGFRSVDLLGPDNDLKITGVKEMRDDAAYILDWDSVEFHGDQFFQRKRHMDGRESFLVRNTTGYQYLVDIKFYGDLICKNPSHNGIIYGINY